MTVDVHTHELARPFVVLATQNPIEFEGTYPLPEAQVDRFMVRLSLGYPTRPARSRCSARTRSGDRVDVLEPVATAAELLAAQDAGAARARLRRAARLRRRRCSRRTREDPRVELGASPRAGLLLLRAAKARALLRGRDHALPDDVQALAEVVLAHRIVLAPEALDVTRRADRRRRAGGDAGAVGATRMRPAAATALLGLAADADRGDLRRRAALRARRRR